MRYLALVSELIRRTVPIERPEPDGATEAAVRRRLGVRRPLEAGRGAEAVDRLDLLAEALTAETLALVVLWLGGTRRASDKTRQAYADDLLLWAAWARRELGRERFGLDLHRGEVTLWVTHQQDAKAASSSIARRLSALSSLYRYAAGWGLPVTSPISDDDHRPKFNRGRRATSARVVPADDIARMLAAATDARDAFVVGVLFTDALRVSELCAANADDVQDEGRRCWLAITRKGGQQVRVVLDPSVAEFHDAYVAVRPEWTDPNSPAPLVVDAAGKRLDRHDVTRMLRRLARRAGIPLPNTVTPHAMRASAITDQITRGRTAEQVQEISGHLDLRTVMIYVEQADQTELLTDMTQDLSRVMASIPTKVRSRADVPPP
jgi:integrase/recombinase XerD